MITNGIQSLIPWPLVPPQSPRRFGTCGKKRIPTTIIIWKPSSTDDLNLPHTLQYGYVYCVWDVPRYTYIALKKYQNVIIFFFHLWGELIIMIKKVEGKFE